MPQHSYVCASCGRAFKALQHMRSHQSRSCSVPIPPNGPVPPASSAPTRQEDVPGVEDASTGQPDACIGQEEQSDAIGVNTDLSHEQPPSFQPLTFLNQLDDRRGVADEIFKFYSSLSQRSEPIVDHPPESILEHVRECPPVVQRFIENCSDLSLPRRAITVIYDTFASCESTVRTEDRTITNFIPRLTHLFAIIKALRVERLFVEQWRTAIIDLNDLHSHLDLHIAINTSGTFRCPLTVLKQQLRKHGTWSIQSYRKSEDENGIRTFSCPCDSYAMQSYSEEVGEKGVVVAIDMYCDGIALPNNGSQTLTPLRVRFSNVRGIQTTWFDIGLCPTLSMENSLCTSSKLAELRGELLQRYLFLVFKDVLETSTVGFRHDCTTIFPRILMVLCDQKQERPLLCLKSSNSTRDCTSCDMVSRITTTEATSRNPKPKQPRKRKRNVLQEDQVDSDSASQCSHSSMGTQSAQSPSSNRTQSSDSSKASRRKAQQAALAAECLRRQLDERPAPQRNVVRSLGAQLILAISKIRNRQGETNVLLEKLRSTLHPSWFDVSDNELKKVREFSMLHSFAELPPSLAACHGLGTQPFHLYNSIAFDTLHAIDLGIPRAFPDYCFQHFSADTNFTSLPTTQCISIANYRLRYITRGAQLSKIPLFMGKASEQLAGVTGLVRRKSCPFLWICVLGLNTTLRPDDDPLLQAALELNDIHCKLLGINEDVTAMHRSEEWVRQLQHQCFHLGKQFTALFNIRVNTKLHRVMRHLYNHMTSFGLVRWGATDENESHHKTLKKAYINTNRRPQCLALQLLKNGYADNIDPEHEQSEGVPNAVNPDPSDALHSTRNHVSSAVTSTIVELNSSRSFDKRMDKLVNLKYAHNNSLVWSSLSFVTLALDIPWEVCRKRQNIREQYTYRPWFTSNENIRTDACVYVFDNNPYTGFVQTILRNRKHQEKVYFVMRRLVPASSDQDNTLPSLKYKHQRYKYDCNSHGGLQLDFVQSACVKYPLFLVVDPTVLIREFGIHTISVDRLETEQNRLKSCFFSISGVPLTSFKEFLFQQNDESSELPSI